VASIETQAPGSATGQAFAQQVLDFLGFLELERGLSRNTLQAYRADLLQFGAFLDRRGLSAENAHRRDVSDFLTSVASGESGDPAATSTIKRKAASLRSFYRHLRREGVLDSDPTAGISTPRKSGRLPNVLGRAEVARLLDQVKSLDPLALRDRALLELMYACGLRACAAG
jgi:integrase/recombinase XerD